MSPRHSGAPHSGEPRVHNHPSFDCALSVPISESRVYGFRAHAFGVPWNDYDSIFTYSKSPGLLSMPTFGGELHAPNLPGSVSDFIRLAMKSPSSVEGSHSLLRLLQVA